MTDELRILLSRVAVVAIWLAALLALSLIVSFLAPALTAILADGARHVTAARERVWARLTAWWAERWERFWEDRRQEPREPMIGSLDALRTAVDRFGDVQRGHLERLVERLDVQAGRLQALVAPSDRTQTVQAGNTWTRPRATLFGILATILTALLLGGLNAFLLNIFFRETIGAYRLLPYPLPDLQASLLIAILFFIFEVVAGAAMHAADSERRRMAVNRASLPAGDPRLVEHVTTATDQLKRAAPWFALLALLLVELSAYSVLSARMNLPAVLGITEDSAFYGAARYVFALFGAAITLILAVCGHGMASQIEAYREVRAENAFRRAVARGRETAASQAERTREQLDRIRQAGATLGSDATTSFNHALAAVVQPEAPLDARVMHTLDQALQVALIRGTYPRRPGMGALAVPDDPPLPVRTASQVRADMLVHVAAGVVLVALVVLTASQALGVIAAVTGRNSVIGWAVAIALPVVTVLLALLARNALRGLAYATSVEGILPGPTSRRWAGVLYAGAVALVVCLFAALSVSARTLGGSTATNGLLGLVEGAALAGVGMLADAIIVHVWNAVQLAILGTSYAAAWVASVLGFVVAGALHIVAFVLRVVAVPGNVLRGQRQPRASYLPASRLAP